ncbi:UNVERIFIED_CONTAM: hypothetical protein RMT77_014622 [Armadillidium vulgare]
MPKHAVLVTRNDIPQVALDRIKEYCDVDIYPKPHPIPREILLEKVQGKSGIYCLLTDKIDKEVLDAAGKNLKVVSTMSVGFDHLSLDEIKGRGIKVGYTPGVLTNATSDLTVALLLATSRRLFEAHNELLNGGWAKCSWSPMWMTGWSLSGSTVGIFGLGRIGLGVVKRLQGFGVGKFIYNSRSKKKEGDEVCAEFVSFEELLSRSDFLIVTAALNEETKGCFSRDAFSKMKKNAVFVNTSRGGLVDQDALIDALKSGQIQAAGLDVMTPEPLPLDHPLINTPNLSKFKPFLS